MVAGAKDPTTEELFAPNLKPAERALLFTEKACVLYKEAYKVDSPHLFNRLVYLAKMQAKLGELELAWEIAPKIPPYHWQSAHLPGIDDVRGYGEKDVLFDLIARVELKKGNFDRAYAAAAQIDSNPVVGSEYDGWPRGDPNRQKIIQEIIPEWVMAHAFDKCADVLMKEVSRSRGDKNEEARDSYNFIYAHDDALEKTAAPLFRMLGHLNKTDQALTYAQKIFPKNVLSQSAMIRETLLFQSRTGDVDAAIKQGRSYFKPPCYCALLCQMAAIQSIQGHTVKAEQLFQESQQLSKRFEDPWPRALLEQLVVSYARGGQYDKACGLIPKLEERRKQEADTYQAELVTYVPPELGYFLPEQCGRDAMGMISLIAIDNNHPEEARKIASRNPDKWNASTILLKIALFQTEKGNKDESRKTLELAWSVALGMKDTTGKPGRLLELVRAMVANGNGTKIEPFAAKIYESLSVFKDSKTLPDTEHEIRFNLARLEAEAGLINSAIKHAESMTKESDRNNLLQSISLILMKQGNLAAAEALSKRNPNNSKVYSLNTETATVEKSTGSNPPNPFEFQLQQSPAPNTKTGLYPLDFIQPLHSPPDSSFGIQSTLSPKTENLFPEVTSEYVPIDIQAELRKQSDHLRNIATDLTQRNKMGELKILYNNTRDPLLKATILTESAWTIIWSSKE